MKTVLSYAGILIASMIVIYLIANFGPLGWIAAGLFVSAIYAGGLWIGHALEIRQHRRQVDNIYICSLSPDDRTVLKRARHRQKYLRLAGNYVDEKGVRHGNGVEVIAIIFQDSLSGRYPEAPAETWEEFEERRDLMIRKDKIARRLMIDNGNEEMRRFYEKVVLNQL